MPSLNIKNFKFNLSVFLWIVLTVVLVLDAVAVQKSYAVLRGSQTLSFDTKPVRSARLNFEAYRQATSRIEGAQSYQPGEPSSRNPFLSAPKKKE